MRRIVTVMLIWLVVSASVSASAAPFIWKNVGGNPYVGTGEEAVKLFSLPEDVKKEILKQESKWVVIPQGANFEEMVFGKQELRKNVLAQWEKHAALAAEVRTVREYEVFRFDWCNNWGWRKVPPVKAELPVAELPVTKPSVVPVSVPDEGEIFIKVFFLSLPPKDDEAREILKKDPRAMEMSTFHRLNEATRKTPREGRFLLRLFTSREPGPSAFVAEIRVKGGVGMWSARRNFLQQYTRYEIWPDENTKMSYFFWPPSGWQKGEVSEFLKARMHHRVFLAE